MQKNIDYKSENDIDDIIQNEYVDRIIDELKPKVSLLPQTPYKTIVGICDVNLFIKPYYLNGISKFWK